MQCKLSPHIMNETPSEMYLEDEVGHIYEKEEDSSSARDNLQSLI